MLSQLLLLNRAMGLLRFVRFSIISRPLPFQAQSHLAPQIYHSETSLSHQMAGTPRLRCVCSVQDAIVMLPPDKQEP